MKRPILMTIFLLSIILFIAACSSSESPATPPDPIESTQREEGLDDLVIEEEVSEGNSDELGERLSVAFVDIMANDNFTMVYSTLIEMDGKEIEARMTMVRSHDRNAFKMDSEIVSTTTITEEDKMYIISDETQTVMVMAFNPDEIIEDEFDDSPTLQDIDASSMEYIGKGTGTFMGNTRDYEEYLVDGDRILYYFDGNHLDGMELISDSGTTIMDIEVMTDDVDESIFEIPENYQMIEIGG